MVRLFAKQLNVDLAAVSASGEHGVITREDVENAGEAKSCVT